MARLVLEVCRRPAGAVAQPIVGSRVAQRLPGQRELGRAPLEVIAPRRLRVEGVGQRGDDVGVAVTLAVFASA